MSNLSNYGEESEAVKSLKIELEIVNAKNIHLTEENALLRHKLIRQTNQQIAKSQGNLDSQMKLFSLEEERDKMYENLERLKAKYNSLHLAFLEKAKRCKTLEEVFARQKMLPGLVKKSALEQTSNNAVIVDNSRDQQLQDENVMNSNKIATLQRSLDEAFDIIDELEFELESVDFLEIENERLKKEMSKHKKKDVNTTTTTINDDNNNDNQINEVHRLGYEKSSTECAEESVSDSLPDLESIERSIQTQSLIDSVQAESHLLRRELLRSRLQNTTRPPIPQRPSWLQQPSSDTQKEENASEE